MDNVAFDNSASLMRAVLVFSWLTQYGDSNGNSL